MMAWQRHGLAGLMLCALLAGSPAWAQIAETNKISDVRGTKHNLSAAPDGTSTPSGGKVPVRSVKATSETQVCVFCHTPHEAEQNIGATPLWNRKLSGATYTPLYNSSSIEAAAADVAQGPGGSSKLCLSCHDGTMAIDKVNVLNGIKDATIPMTGGVTPFKMPTAGASTGFTRNLGTDLSSDHPISLTYNAALSIADGELRAPDGLLVGNRARGATPPKLPLESNQVQCATCHDPHLRDTTTANGNAKFLRMNRFQVTQPAGGNFDAKKDIICLACHTKAGNAWALSAHANSNVATQTYTAAAALLREFPSTSDLPPNANPPVWQVGCLNCHDTHSIAGSRRLLREGTDGIGTPKTGGKAALEETCYQCHTTTAGSALTAGANPVPDIKTDFALARHMPIASAATEVHDIGGTFDDTIMGGANCTNTPVPFGNCGKDLLESRVKLGAGLGNLGNRHAECTDCHNPHRVIKGQNGLPGLLNAANTSEKAGTHRHEDAAGFIHVNIVSGVLRGSWGVEPIYPNNSFQSMPSSFAVKRGDPGTSTATNTSRPAAETFVTREYQICLKCHSNYGYDDDNLYPNGAKRPDLGAPGLTPVSSNGHVNFTKYTNQAKEFQAPVSHAVGVGTVSLGTNGGAAVNTNNHRSWHPVMAPTGRVNRLGKWLAPWNNAGALGVQTMFCSDCHGSATAAGTVMPVGNTNTSENGQPWGPHGSNNNFLLKGDYNAATGAGQTGGLCFKCHNITNYATKDGGGTGFQTDRGDGHGIHSDRIRSGIKCNYCHVGVPHGWKNRSLLVNLNDVGAEAGLAAGTGVSYSNGVGYSNGPYYRNSFLKVTSFPSGSNWTENNCNGGKDGMITNCQNGP